MAKIQRALLSVTDKTGLVEFAQQLSGMGVELISTGGTAKLLRDSGIAVKDISELTGFPEMLDGRVKTLHPKVHGGILHIRDNAQHVAAVAEHGIQPIDMVVVNLYAFEKTASKPGVEFHDVIENIDIGGPSMVRSAAKNFQDVAIVTSPADYEAIAQEMEAERRFVVAGDQVAAGAESVCDDGGVRLGDCIDAGGNCAAVRRQVCDGRPRGLSGDAATLVPQGVRSSLRRESAPESGAVRRWLGQRRGQRKAAAGQGTQLQQHCRSAGGVGPGAGVRGAGGRHHQAHKPVRHGGGSHIVRGLSAGAGVRSGVGVRRRDRRESADRCGDGDGDGEAVPGGDRGAEVRCRGTADFRNQEEPAAGGSRSARAEVGDEERLRRRCCCRTTTCAR